MNLRMFALALSMLAATSTTVVAVPVEVQITGKVAVNTFTTFPFNGTPPGTDVMLRFVVESTSGLQLIPGFRLGLTVTSATLHFDESSAGPIVLPIDLNLPYTMPVFATVAIVPSLPNQDEIDFGGGIPFALGGLRFNHTFKVADGDDVSWPTADFAQLSVCGVPGTNFTGPNPNDFKHWYLLGDLLNPGSVNIQLLNIRRVALSGGDGDLDRDGSADGRDLQWFVDAMLSASTDPVDLCHGDFSLNGVIDTADIPGMVQTLLTGVPPATPAPFGACCYLDPAFVQTCVEVPSLSTCLALSGSEHSYTFGRHCADLDPACGGGACCFAGGACEQFGLPGSTNPVNDCTLAGGNFQGFGVSCSPNTCFGAPGACCLVDGFGLPTGACQFVTSAECAALSGVFFGEGIPCDPVPCIGACCVQGQDCQVLPLHLCTGDYKGDGTTCDFSPCPPANDLCIDAVPVTEGTTTFTLAGATTDGDAIPNATPGCPQGFDPDNFIARDVWFAYTPICTGTVQIDTCGSYFFGDSSDTTIAVYAGCGICPPDSASPALIACSKSHSTGAPIQHCIASPNDASVRFQAVAGQCYTIRAGTTNATTFGISVLNIICGGACCPPDGSLCTLTTQDECENVIGGFYAGNGTDCTFETCPGACCLQSGDELNCVMTSVQQCLQSNGTYLGDGSFCEADSCGGACCLPGNPDCEVTTAEDCAAQAGNFLGYGVACNWDIFGISICAAGACCDGVTCTNEVRGSCEADFIVGQNCATYTCLDATPGACCVGQTCTDTIYAVCRDQLDGDFYFFESCQSFTCP